MSDDERRDPDETSELARRLLEKHGIRQAFDTVICEPESFVRRLANEPPPETFPDGPYRPDHWPEWARDEIVAGVSLRPGWLDWLWTLFGQTIDIEARIVCSTPPGRVAAKWEAQTISPLRRLASPPATIAVDPAAQAQAGPRSGEHQP